MLIKNRSRFFRSRRALRRMSQTDLAEAIGYSVVRLSHFETGKAIPPIATAKKICRLLRAPMEELFPDLAEQSPPVEGAKTEEVSIQNQRGFRRE